MKHAIIVAVLLCAIAWQPANAGESIFDNGHSVEAIRTALNSPIPYEIQRKAQEFDDQVVRSGAVGDQKIQIVTDERYDRANRIIRRLLEAIPRGNASKWTVRVLDSNPKVENAFGVGGTYIYVYTGLLDDVQSDDELALILAHEISHSLLKHGMRRGEDFSNLVTSIIELAGAFSKSGGRREKMGLIAGTIKASYSREDEQEPDALGAYIANRANFDPMRGIAFFNRMIDRETSANQNNQYQLAKAKQQIDQQLAACESLRAQWNFDPRVHTPQNAQIINSTCQAAQLNAQRYNEAVTRQSRAEVQSLLLQTHPAYPDRIAALTAAADYLKGRRSLASLSGIGQGYNVFVAMNLPPVAPPTPLVQSGEQRADLSQQEPPPTDKHASVKVRFTNRCQGCHGADGKGNPAMAKALLTTIPDLTSRDIAEKPDSEILEALSRGRGKMPPQTGLSDKELRDLVAYVRSFSEGPAKQEPHPTRADVEASQMPFPSDFTLTQTRPLGSVVFSHNLHVTEQKLQCSDCHTNIFQMKRTSTAMKMVNLNKREYCGACHDGQKAFSTKEVKSCAKCHARK